MPCGGADPGQTSDLWGLIFHVRPSCASTAVSDVGRAHVASLDPTRDPGRDPSAGRETLVGARNPTTATTFAGRIGCVNCVRGAPSIGRVGPDSFVLAAVRAGGAGRSPAFRACCCAARFPFGRVGAGGLMVKLPQLATIEQVLAEALQGLDFGRSGIAPRSPGRSPNAWGAKTIPHRVRGSSGQRPVGRPR